MKRVTITAILIAILVGGIVFVNFSGFGTSILSLNPQASNGNGNGNSENGNGGSGNNGNGNGNSGTNDNGNGNNGNGASGGSNGNNEKGNSDTGNNGNGNGNNENNGNGNNGNANGSGNGNGNSNGNNGNGNNGNGNSGSNGNSGNGNSENGGTNDNSNGNGTGNNNGNNENKGNEGNNDNNGNGGGGNGNNGGNDNGNGNGGSNDNGNGNQGNSGSGDTGNGSSGSGGNNGNGGGSNTGNNGNSGSNSGNSRYKISGYILDSNGNPIEGAQIIYCVPDIVPAQFSTKSGYYEMNAPAGQYQVDVWPPFNSHYIFFEQKYLTVNSDLQMNITLQTGYRLSGIITTSSGAPLSGAVVWLDNPAQGNHYFCGWYSKTDGSYFVTAPHGTYTLKIQPKTGLTFPSYSEAITIINDQVKNIIIGNSINAQDPNAPQTSVLSLSVGSNSFTIGSVLHLSGKLLALNANPLVGKTIILSYSIANTNFYTQIGSGTTDSAGVYKIDWLVPASGTFTLKVEWVGNSGYFPGSSTTTLTFST